MATLTEQLRAEAGARFEAIVHHRFTDELAAGTIDRSVLKTYLVQDHRFVDAFVRALPTAGPQNRLASPCGAMPRRATPCYATQRNLAVRHATLRDLSARHATIDALCHPRHAVPHATAHASPDIPRLPAICPPPPVLIATHEAPCSIPYASLITHVRAVPSPRPAAHVAGGGG